MEAPEIIGFLFVVSFINIGYLMVGGLVMWYLAQYLPPIWRVLRLPSIRRGQEAKVTPNDSPEMAQTVDLSVAEKLMKINLGMTPTQVAEITGEKLPVNLLRLDKEKEARWARGEYDRDGWLAE